MIAHEEVGSGLWESGAAPMFSHEFPLDQKGHAGTAPLDHLMRVDEEDAYIVTSDAEGSVGHHDQGHRDDDDDDDDAAAANTRDGSLKLPTGLDLEPATIIVSATLLPPECCATPSLSDHGSETDDPSYDQTPMEFSLDDLPNRLVEGEEDDDDDLIDVGDDALPAFLTSVLHEDEDEAGRVEYAPLLAHECLGPADADDDDMTSMSASVPSIALPVLDHSPPPPPPPFSSSRGRKRPQVLEKFPSDGRGIWECIRRTERRLSEDLTSDDGGNGIGNNGGGSTSSRISSPAHGPTSTTPPPLPPLVVSVAATAARPSSSSSHERTSPRLDKIPEDFILGGPATDVDADVDQTQHETGVDLDDGSAKSLSS